MTSTAVTIPCILAARYGEVRGMTERLCAPLSAEDQMVQPMPDASPAKWHQAHTTWFFETFILLPHAPGYRAFDERFTYVFNSYYKQLGGHPVRANRGFMSRPSLEEVRAYRTHVDGAMQAWLERGVSHEVAALVELGLNHEQQHQELIVTDVKYALWSQPLRPAYRSSQLKPVSSASSPRLSGSAVSFPDGIYDIGHSGHGFCFDNETPRHRVLLNAFSLATHLVTNGEYLAFMRDGGYANPALWLSDGWDAVNAQGWRAPLYWEERDGRWYYFTMEGMHEVDLNEPVCHVSYYEADAFARWAGRRLPLEAEWEVAAERKLQANSGRIAGNFLDNQRFHPEPSSMAPAPSALDQLFGDVWEWTASPYVAYPGFEPAAGALGEYNGKFMCNQFVLRGGSCATPQSHIRASYRNFFPPHARWQFMGIRLAK